MDRLIPMVATAAMLCAATVSNAQPAPADPAVANYPARAIRVIAGFPPASGADITARIGEARSGAAPAGRGQPAGGENIAAELAASTARRLHAFIDVANAINATLSETPLRFCAILRRSR
jgi:tripartite-type tricarboxylate transporter receptor subunit TctC